MRGDDGMALNSACQSHFADFFTRSFAGMTLRCLPAAPISIFSRALRRETSREGQARSLRTETRARRYSLRASRHRRWRPPARHAAGQRPGTNSPLPISGPSLIVRRSPPGWQSPSARGAPACQIQISEASTRCQCERSPAASRNKIALAAPLPPASGLSRHSSR